MSNPEPKRNGLAYAPPPDSGRDAMNMALQGFVVPELVLVADNAEPMSMAQDGDRSTAPLPPAQSGPSGREAHFGSFNVGGRKFLRSFSETRNHPRKDFHGLPAPFGHFRFNSLLSRFWLITGARSAPV